MFLVTDNKTGNDMYCDEFKILFRMNYQKMIKDCKEKNHLSDRDMENEENV